MAVMWNLYRFDYVRYVALRRYLRTAADAAEFAGLAEGPETEAIVEALVEGEIDVLGARQAFVVAQCCIGEPLPCPQRFPRIVKRLRRDVRAELGAEILIEAVLGSRDVESWLGRSGKLTGFLNPDETAAVLDAYRFVGKRLRAEKAGNTAGMLIRHLFHNAVTFVRRLFDRGLAADEVYRLLGELLEAAVAEGHGIAVVLA